MRLMRGYWWCIAVILTAGCAQVAEISGGDRDTEPPELIAAEPPSLTTNFTGDRIILVFNERIQLERVRERLLISP
ncbi:MAG: Ig-like domain-containing protein, partial [Bacteroidota bacterium]|nr:Ig-like domain-containing protein [Bacteroidota bacterium]